MTTVTQSPAENSTTVRAQYGAPGSLRATLRGSSRGRLRGDFRALGRGAPRHVRGPRGGGLRGTFRAPGRGGVRTIFRALERVAPGIGARWAERIWFTLPRVPVPARRREQPPAGAAGEVVVLSVGGGRVVAEAWGSGAVVYLMHGWGGWRTQLDGFVAPLVASGFRVVAIDAPSHGDSDPGRYGPRQGTFVEFADALAAAEARFGPPYAIVAHSGGATAVGLRLRAGSKPRRLVLIAALANPADYLDILAGLLGFGARTRRRLMPRVVRRVGLPMSHFDLPALAAQIPTPPVLVIHDREDRETPWSGSAAVASAWPAARLITTTGLGHRRVLRDPGVVRDVVHFLDPGVALVA